MAEAVEKCIEALRSAKTDTEKFAALLLITKVVTAQDCDREKRRQIFDAVGFTFVNRLLTTKDVPDGCPVYIYQSISLTLLSCFCTEPELARNPQMMQKASEFADVIFNSGSSHDEEVMVLDALQCISCIANTEEGKKVIEEQGVLAKLCKFVASGRPGHEQATVIILRLLSKGGSSSWNKDPQAFNELVTKFATEFVSENSEKKFELCQKLVAMMRTFPDYLAETSETAKWYTDIHRGLQDILFSKVAVPHMEPALTLASVMLEKLGVRWAIGGDSEKGTQFFLIFVHLACIEVRMILEDRTFDQAVDDGSLLVACFTSIETVIGMMVTNETVLNLEPSQKQQLYSAVTSALNAVIGFLSGVSQSQMGPLAELDESKRQVLFASLRMMSAWLAEETAAYRDEVYDLLPFLLKTAEYTFGRVSSGHEDEVDTLRFLLPGLCHLSAEDKSREILLNHNFQRVLLDYLSYHWKIWPKREKIGDSDTTFVTICGILMNITVLETELVTKDKVFQELLHFIFRALPELEYNMKHLVLIGNLSVLGMLLLRHHAAKMKSCETAVYRYLSASIKFLWDAHNIEDSRDFNTMVIARDYRKVWDQVMELWFLGMQALSTVLPKMPWIAQFIVESGWTGVIIESLIKIREGAIDASTKSAYEHVLCCLVQSGEGVSETLKKQGALQVCALHKMKELESLLSPQPV